MTTPTMRDMHRTTMRGLVDRHLKDLSDNLAESTIDSKRAPLRQFARWWDAKRLPPAKLTATDVYDFLYDDDGMKVNMRGRKPTQVSNASYNVKLSHLRTFILWTIEQRVVTDGAVLGQLKKAHRNGKKGVSKKVRLSLSQIMYAVESCPDPWERWLVAFAFLTQGRKGELLNTRMSDINLEVMRIKWSRPKVDDYDDELPMLDQLAKEYARWKAAYEQLCPGAEVNGGAYAVPRRKVGGRDGCSRHYNSRLPPVKVGHIIKAASARALGVDPETLRNQAAHIARRSGARAMLDQLTEDKVEDPIRVVMAMLGHEKQDTTEKYLGTERDRERRNKVVAGSKLLNFETDNVVPLHRVG